MSKIEDAVIVEAEASSPEVKPEENTAAGTSETKPEDSGAIEATDVNPEDNVEAEAADTAQNAPETPVEAEVRDAEEKSEPAAPTASAAPPPEKKSIFLPLVLGGVIAGALGFMASEYKVFGNDDAAITTQLRNDLNTQQERIAALEQVEAQTVDLSPIEEQLASLNTRISELESRPAVVVPEGVDADAAAAYAAELEALKAAAETQRSEIEALINNAKTVEEATADAARAANGQAAIAKIVSALDAGQPFPDAVDTLQSLELGEIDAALTAPASEGVVTLSVLQAEFPDLARAALAAARESGVGDGQQGIGGFLTRSLGVRSVAPREGNDPDAVLSRAEAAVKSGDLAAALAELDTLPEEAQAVMTDWRAAADARVSARAAADALAQRLTAD